MESRKMVLKNLFTGSNGETDMENRLMDMGRGEERVRCMERVTGTLTLPYVKSVQFSCSVVSDSLRPHESQHARPPCPCKIVDGNLLYVSRNSNRGSVST